MTTTAALSPSSTRPAPPAVTGTLTFPGIVRSEWLKLRTLRSTWITLGAMLAVMLLACLVVSTNLHNDLAHPTADAGRGPRNPITAPLVGYNIAQLVIGVLGVLSVSGEYATGMTRASLTAVPKRLPVLWAKLVVFGTLALVVSAVGVLAAFFVGQAVLGSYGTSLSAAGASRAVFGLVVYLALIGLLALATGFMVRSTAGGIAAVFGVILVLPGILELVGASWSTTLGHYLPSAAGSGIFTLDPDAGTLSPWAGFAVLLGWVVAAVAGAAVLLKRRDA